MCTIFTDMDNVTADLNRYVVEEVNAREGTNYKPEDTTDWWWSNLGVSQEYLNGILCEPYAFEFLEPVEGAIEGINKLKEFGLDIIFLTTPHYDSLFSMEEKKMWLDIHFEWFDPYKHLIFTGRKELVGTKNDILIDDSISNLKGFKGIKICFDAPWNKEWNGLRFDNWDELADYLIDLEKINKIN